MSVRHDEEMVPKQPPYTARQPFKYVVKVILCRQIKKIYTAAGLIYSVFFLSFLLFLSE